MHYSTIVAYMEWQSPSVYQSLQISQNISHDDCSRSRGIDLGCVDSLCIFWRIYGITRFFCQIVFLDWLIVEHLHSFHTLLEESVSELPFELFQAQVVQLVLWKSA